MQGAVGLVGGLFFLVVGMFTRQIVAFLFGAVLSVIAAGPLWLAFRKGGPYDFRS